MDSFQFYLYFYLLKVISSPIFPLILDLKVALNLSHTYNNYYFKMFAQIHNLINNLRSRKKKTTL